MEADELLERCRREQDRRAYEELVEAHRPLVASVCRRFLRDPDDLDDAVQETFLKFAANLDTLTGSVPAWLSATAQAASVDLIRRSIRERNRRQGLAKTARIRGASSGTELEQLALREAVRARLHDAMRLLGPAERDVLAERFFRRTPLGVLAVQLGVSVPTASRRVTAALRHLSLVLRDLGVPAASEQMLADHLGDAHALDACEEDYPDHGGLRFAPDWWSADLTPLGAPSAPSASPLLGGWS